MLLPILPIFNIKIVFFDIGNTILHFDFDLLARELGDESWADKFRCKAPQVWRELNRYLARSAISKTSGDGVLQNLLFTLFSSTPFDNKHSFDIAHEVYKRHILWGNLDQNFERCAAFLKQNGIRLGVISNSDGRTESVLTKLNLLHHFELVIDSGTVGLKPAREIFDYALTCCGLEAYEAAYVGDLPDVDVVGAQAAGLLPFLYDQYSIHDSFMKDEVVPTFIRVLNLMELGRSIVQHQR